VPAWPAAAVPWPAACGGRVVAVGGRGACGGRVACVGFAVAYGAVVGVVCGGCGARGQRRPFCPLKAR